MNYYDNVLGLIGHTPLIKLSRLNKGLKPLILAKMENLNPGFSVKDRIGISMIEAAEREGKLKPGDSAPDVALVNLDGSRRVLLRSLTGGQPVVLVFGSYT